MIRIVGLFVGLGFFFVVMWSFGVGAYTAATTTTPETAEHAFYKYPKDTSFSFDGPFGSWDEVQLQRGLKVYQEVCAACHGLEQVSFRALGEIGYTEAEVKAIAAAASVPGIDPNTGEATTRPGLPTDKFPSPYPNDVAAAAANNNAIPPDLSLMTKARPSGTAYIYSLLTGYQEVPEKLAKEFPDSVPGTGLHYNPYFKNLNVAMADPITVDGQVTYDDGTEATKDQMAKDVAAFLTWTAEPTMVERKKTGFWWLGFLVFATILAYLSKKQIWSSVKPKD